MPARDLLADDVRAIPDPDLAVVSRNPIRVGRTKTMSDVGDVGDLGEIQWLQNVGSVRLAGVARVRQQQVVLATLEREHDFGAAARSVGDLFDSRPRMELLECRDLVWTNPIGVVVEDDGPG